MKRLKFSLIFLCVSIFSICLTAKINHDIAIYYINTDGKGRALSGIFEHLFDYKYFYLLLGVFSIVLICLGHKHKESKGILLLALTLALLSIGIIFVSFWKCMI